VELRAAPPPPRAAPPVAPEPEPAEAISADVSDVLARRERLLEVKRKVEDAVRPRPRAEPAPENPARAGESAIALVKELESQLARVREVETALHADLDEARSEVARGAADVRRVTERLTAAELEVQSKREVLAELLEEMKALEQERDRAMERAQALATLDEERQELLVALSTRAEDAEKARALAESEIERLCCELDDRSADGARLRAALAMVTRERDDLAREAATAKREKHELEEARRALEAVHDALSQARTRLG
jgi:chromosome segregation ATPase